MQLIPEPINDQSFIPAMRNSAFFRAFYPKTNKSLIIYSIFQKPINH
tara:strand:+ start:408 stop:548 length:141 start_codon:yes stop_codon:yes gene_type:complete